MKKVLVSAIALFSIVSMNSAVAQKGFSLSVKASPQFNWMNNTNDKPTSIYDRRSTFGASFGVGGQYNFTDHMGVGLDVLYSLQGQKYHLDGEKYHQKNDYVKVPLLFAFTAGPLDKVAFYGKVGPQLSFLTNSKLDGDLKRVETRDRFRNVTLGGAAAAGVQFALAKNISLNTGLRVDHDFTNVENNNNPVYNSGTAVSHNSTLGLEVGLNYKFK